MKIIVEEIMRFFDIFIISLMERKRTKRYVSNEMFNLLNF